MALLEDREWREEDLDAFELLCSASDEGPWVTQLPAALVAQLADVPDAALEALSRRWGETEELQLDASELPHVRALIVEMRRLAQLARVRNEALLMWVSL